MSFAVTAAAYDRFMGRYSVPLASRFIDLVGVREGWRVLDVGCGPGAVLTELCRRIDVSDIVGVDPSVTFVEAAKARHPGVEVHSAGAEALPFADDSFDCAVAQLVVHFMADPVAGLGEMRRVTRPGGVVGACVWDFDEGGSPLSAFWSVASELDPAAPGERALPGARRGHLASLLRDAGLAHVRDSKIGVDVVHRSFDDWWRPYELGVGPVGTYVASLDDDRLVQLRDRCRQLRPDAEFTVSAFAWAATGVVPA